MSGKRGTIFFLSSYPANAIIQIKGGGDVLDKNDLEAIAQLMDRKLTPINERLDNIENCLDQVQEDIEALKENSAINRNGVNTLLEWAEKAQVQVQIPLFKKAE